MEMMRIEDDSDAVGDVGIGNYDGGSGDDGCSGDGGGGGGGGGEFNG